MTGRSAADASAHWAGSRLLVDGKPYLVVGAEVHNSSSSTVRAIQESFDAVRVLGANTVLAPVAWDLFEPVEGRFDPTLIDAMIATATAQGLKLIPLWFGSWKNAASTYVPEWVKCDAERFPRIRLSDGRRIETLTPFSAASQEADAKAFGALMKHIAEVDSASCVIAVQVENEIGMLGDSRDRSAHADAVHSALVPRLVVDAIAGDPGAALHQTWKMHGSKEEGAWDEVFPPGLAADEAFMATGFASYTQAVAEAGLRQLSVPLFVNTWLDQDSVLDGSIGVAGGKRPGDYPSGGPVLGVAAIWEALAPAVDFIAPDVYVEDASTVFAAYKSRRDRLFVPELRGDVPGIPQMFAAVGIHNALGVSPFGVDSYRPDDPEWADLHDAFTLLRAVAVIIAQTPGALVRGFVIEEKTPSASFELGSVRIEVTNPMAGGGGAALGAGYGIVIDDGDTAAYVIGRGFVLTLTAPAGRTAGFLSAVALELDDESIVPSLRLNGDETASGTLIPFPDRRAGLVPGRAIPTRIPDTGIVRIDTYTF